MKIISSKLDDRYKGILRALDGLVEMHVWKPEEKPIYDLFDEVEPDLVLYDIDNVGNNFIQNIIERNLKSVLFGSKVPEYLNPTLVCSEPNISPVLKKNLEINHDCIFIYDYADTVTFHGGVADDNFACQIGYISKGGDVDANQISKLLLLAANKFKVKVVGPERIPIPQYLGGIAEEREMDFLRSCRIALDTGNNVLDQVANSIFTMSILPNNLACAANIDNIQMYLDDEELRNRIITTSRKKVLASATGYHRIVDIFNKLELEDVVVMAEEKIGELQ